MTTFARLFSLSSIMPQASIDNYSRHVSADVGISDAYSSVSSSRHYSDAGA